MKVDILNLLVDDIFYSKAVNTYTLYFDDIVESISSNGLLMKPIVVKEGAITYRLEDGHLRIEALKRLGISDVVAIVLIPEENEKKEDIKKKIDDILLADYDNVKLNKVFPPYYIDQQKMLLNMIDSFDKIQKDLTHINEQIAKNDTNLLLSNDKKLPLTDINNINNMVNNLKNEINSLNTFILQEISYVNVRYNTENLALKGTELNNLVFNKIKFSNAYLNQTLVSSNQIVNFVDNKQNITNILSKSSPLYEYISKISSNIYQTNYTLLSPKPAYKPLKSLLNTLKIDNKLFKLRNINSLIKKHIFPSRESNVADIKLRQDVGNNIKSNKILKLFNFEHKRNDSIFSKQKIYDVTRFVKRIFNPTPRKPENVHIRPSILNEIHVPTQVVSPVSRKPENVHVRPSILNEIHVPTQVVSPISRKPEGVHIRPSILNEIHVPTQTVSPVSRKPEGIHVRPSILNEIHVPTQTVSPVSRKPESIHVRPSILNEIHVPTQTVSPISRKPEGVHIRPSILNEIHVPTQVVSPVSRKPESIHVRPSILNEIHVPTQVVSPVSRKPEGVHIRPSILNEIHVPTQVVSPVSRKPEGVHVRPSILNEIHVPTQVVSPVSRKPEGVHIRPSILNEINIPTRTVNPINSAITRTLQTNAQRN